MFRWAFLYWAGDIASLWAALWAFGGHPGIVALTLVYTTGYLAQSVPIPFVATGGMDAATTFALTAVGVPLEIALVGVIAHRVFAFWIPLVPGLVCAALLPRTGNALAAAATPVPAPARSRRPTAGRPVTRVSAMPADRGEVLWTPAGDAWSATAAGQFASAQGFADYAALHAWSVAETEDFWRRVTEFTGVRWHEEPAAMCTGSAMPDVSWFPGGTLNYAEHALAAAATSSRRRRRRRPQPDPRPDRADVGRAGRAGRCRRRGPAPVGGLRR